jgi:hypothetical protein
MVFDPRLAEAQITLNRISSGDLPKLAWDALESGLDGPSIRRLGALQLPTAFQIDEVLPAALKEMGLRTISNVDAAVYLARLRAREILRKNSDPLQHLRDFEQLWVESDYCAELQEYGNLADDVYVARFTKESETDICAWVTDRLKRLAES